MSSCEFSKNFISISGEPYAIEGKARILTLYVKKYFHSLMKQMKDLI